MEFTTSNRPSSRIPYRARIILRMLEQLRHGSLRLFLPDGQVRNFGVGDEPHAPAAPISLTLNSWTPFLAALKSGDIGFAESFIDNHWHTDNLPGLLELLARNRQQIESALYGSWLGRLAYRIKHWRNRNTRAGSRKNISAHYDLGNNFYWLWLDPSMSYSAAIFSGKDDQTLEQAQYAKYRRVLQQLQVKQGSRVLEIGCGWGGFAETAIREGGVSLTGLTLSEQQLRYAQKRLQEAGLDGRGNLQLCDYRDVDEPYDAIASIEMFEAVGEEYWDSYFACLNRNLRQGGRACIQSIVIDDALFETYRKGTDFIQQYVFPGGMLPSREVFCKLAQKHGLHVADIFPFGLDYAETLAIWRRQFRAQLREVRVQGFDERFIRTWDFYLAYCEAGFRAGNINVMQFTLIRN
ncbi:cyclopropane-fatty-acyl-phospholipid synthase [Herbaspirillum lusitanum]|uniref:Cyclopropane-fatty-acyl-phospholipid synthase n=1 Tax=Herbaspirillum lusitanum TaxID=213312 RepID=A0ABW9AD41_9BURK